MSSLKELQDLIQEKYDLSPEKLAADASMRATGLDSLSIAEFVFAVEDHFGIQLPDDDPNIDTLGELAALVDRMRAEKTT
jgi:acyl carrier protein